jgi:hypothetical protein
VTTGRRARAWFGSALVHVVLLALAMADAPPDPAVVADSAEVYEIVEVTTLSSPPSTLAVRASSSAAVTPAVQAAPLPRRVSAPPRPAESRPSPLPVAPPPDDDASNEALPAEAEPASAPPDVTLAATTELSGTPSGAAGTGSHAARGGAGDATDHSAYGAAIVRIVKSEIDHDPVAGISMRDSIRLVLTVLPNGDLEWTRDGRFGFADVLASSLGPLRTRQILKRVERASVHFPAHPQGLRGRRYVVDVTIRFDRA